MLAAGSEVVIITATQIQDYMYVQIYKCSEVYAAHIIWQGQIDLLSGDHEMVGNEIDECLFAKAEELGLDRKYCVIEWGAE